MKAKTRQKIVIAALPAAMIWGAYNLFWTDQPEPAAPPAAAVQATAEITGSIAPPPGLDLERVEQARWGADPFRTVIKPSSKPADKPKEELKLILSGIVFNDKSPMAVINKKSVRTGDSINGARIVSIDRNSVTVERNGRTFTLRVSKG
ncbi:MAG: hypothetical protein OEV49_13230 [candidate division Zixibacteria bacterium]|nr:hypothetical protein [candidate division Zixibacteria bacterium]MDH3937768.1 hypothetical protein [candidate division Zixibacteria bacterium]MDH4033994.1 hypothetical protein [candidate division Zixibacteria bacterium]